MVFHICENSSSNSRDPKGFFRDSRDFPNAPFFESRRSRFDRIGLVIRAQWRSQWGYGWSEPPAPIASWTIVIKLIIFKNHTSNWTVRPEWPHPFNNPGYAIGRARSSYATELCLSFLLQPSFQALVTEILPVPISFKCFLRQFSAKHLDCSFNDQNTWVSVKISDLDQMRSSQINWSSPHLGWNIVKFLFEQLLDILHSRP